MCFGVVVKAVLTLTIIPHVLSTAALNQEIQGQLLDLVRTCSGGSVRAVGNVCEAKGVLCSNASCPEEADTNISKDVQANDISSSNNSIRGACEEVAAINLNGAALRQLPFSSSFTLGSIDFDQLPALFSMSIRACSLRGRVPSSLGRLQHLKHLDLSSNLLTGPLPYDVLKAPNLATANLSWNLFQGNLTPELCESAAFLDLSGNAGLRGAIPKCSSGQAPRVAGNGGSNGGAIFPERPDQDGSDGGNSSSSGVDHRTLAWSLPIAVGGALGIGAAVALMLMHHRRAASKRKLQERAQ
ncbi:hypothetical protein DUNSADRAFT_7393, partial [Dunaliella salina]